MYSFSFPFNSGTPSPKLLDNDPLDQEWLRQSQEPPSVTSQPVSQKDVLPGKAVAFSIQARGTQPLKYQWQWKQFGEEAEKDGWKNLSGDGSSLQVVGIQVSNAGYYRCVVSNSAGSGASLPAILTVGKGACKH